MKYVGQINDPKDVVTKTQTDALDTRLTTLENKTNSILTTHREDFDTPTYVDEANTTAFRENGYMRASFQNKFQDLFNDSNNLQMPDADGYTNNGKLVFPTPSGGSYSSVLTKAISNFNTNQVRLVANVAFNGTTGIKKDGTYTPSQSTVIFTNRHVDTYGAEWTVYWSNVAGASGGGLYVSKNGDTPTRVYTATSTLGTTLSSKIALVSDANRLYIGFNSLTTETRLIGINLTDKTVFNTSTPSFTGGSASRVLDIAVVGTNITFLRSHSTGAPTQSILASTITVANSTYTATQNVTFFSDSTSAPFRSGTLQYNSSAGYVLYVAFKNAGTNAVRYGEVSPTNATIFTSTAITSTSNGNGAMIYTGGLYHVVYGTNDSSQLNYRTIQYTNNALSSVVAFGTSSTINGMTCEFIGNVLHIFYANSSSNAIVRSTIDTSNTAVTTTVTLDSINVDQVNAYAYNGTTFKLITCSFAGNTVVYSYGTVTPDLKFQIRKTNGNSLDNEQFYTSSTQSLTFSLSETVSEFMILISTSYALLPATNSPIEIDSYTVDSLNPAFVDGTPSVFISQPLITDRVIDSVMLEAGMENTNNGTITWQVKTSETGSWENVTTLNTFQNVTAGSSLRVKASFQPNLGITNVNNMPKITGYAVSTKNVLTANDLLPLQINLMKLGINVTVLTTASRYGYKNMMIDTFETSNGVQNLNGLTHSNHNGTLTNNTGNPIIVYTTVETADIDTVSNLTLVAEFDETMSFRICRDGGTTFYTLTKENVFSFSDSTATKNQIILEATFQPNAVCYGWAYLYA